MILEQVKKKKRLASLIALQRDSLFVLIFRSDTCIRQQVTH